MIKLFDEKPITELFRLNDQKIAHDLDRLVNIEAVDVEKLSDSMAEQYQINVPKISIAEAKILMAMEGRPGGSYNPFYFAYPDKIYQVAVATYSIPYSGDGELFCIQPIQISFKNLVAWIENNLLNFKIYTQYVNTDLSDEVKKDVLNQAKSITDRIKTTLDQLNLDCSIYNNSLKNRIKADIDLRRADIKKLKTISNN